MTRDKIHFETEEGRTLLSTDHYAIINCDSLKLQLSFIDQFDVLHLQIID